MRPYSSVETNIYQLLLILLILMMEAIPPFETSVLQELHGITPQKTPFFTLTAVKNSNLT
jgi:hypothetical protein